MSSRRFLREATCPAQAEAETASTRGIDKTFRQGKNNAWFLFEKRSVTHKRSIDMRIRKSVSAVVATVIVAALFSGTAGSMTVVAHAESISNKSQTVTLATQALSDRNDLPMAAMVVSLLVIVKLCDGMVECQ